MDKQQIINSIIADIGSKTQANSILPIDVANNLIYILEYASQQGLITSGNGSPQSDATDFGRWYHDITNNKLYAKTDNQWSMLIDLKPKEQTQTTNRIVIDLTGIKNELNTTFKTNTPFVPGTSSIYLNGQRLFTGKDYIEKDDTTIEFCSYVPISTDELIIEADF